MRIIHMHIIMNVIVVCALTLIMINIMKTFESLEDIPYEAFDGWGFRYTSGGVTYARFTNDMDATELSQSITTF